MSRGRSLGSTGLVAGITALPSPPGDVGVLRAAASRLRRAEHAARATGSLRGRLATALPVVWTGAAAEAAVHESAELTRRCTSSLSGLSAAAAALERYAGTLEHTQHDVRRLQHEWDRAVDEHEHIAALVRLSAGCHLETARLLVRLAEEHDAVKARLSQRHAELDQDLTRAATLTAAMLAALDDAALARGAEPTSAALRERLIHDLPIATGAAAAAETRRVAVADAQAARRLLTPGSGVSATPASVLDLVRRLERHTGDPVHAQALIEELGVDGVHRLVLTLGDARGGVGVDVTREAVATLGALLLTAAAPPPDGSRDPRTARQVDSSAAFLRDDLVASLSRVVGDDSTRTRATGYWVVGQLVVGARQAGWAAPIPSGLLRSLAAGAASAEIGETRDADAERAHGSTLVASGGAHFASFFDDADVTGDALHTLLREAGEDPAAVTALLSAPVDGHGLTNSRGGQLVLADALVRRWITYEASSTSSHTDLALATTDDLARLLAVAGTASEPAAALRARVMSEIGRTSSFAQQEFAAIATYEGNTARLEAAAVDWVLAMPESIDMTLRQPETVTAASWSTPVGDGHQPRLRLEELTGLIGAFAVGDDHTRAAKAPTPAYQRLVDGELDRAAQPAPGAGRRDLEAVAIRVGFFEQAASAALVAVARRQDLANQSMWRTFAEAKALAVAWRHGPQAVGTALSTLLSGGTNRTPQDDLAISLIRSDVELEQTTADERRTAGVALALDDLRSAGACPDLPTTALLAAGAGRAPALPTSEHVRAGRQQERLDALMSVVSDRDRGTIEALGAQGRRGPLPPPLTRSPVANDVAEGRDGRLGAFDALPRGLRRAKVVETEADLRALFDELTHGAGAVETPSLDGERLVRSDGVEVIYRRSSTSGGPTIDLEFPDGTRRKVHIR